MTIAASVARQVVPELLPMQPGCHGASPISQMLSARNSAALGDTPVNPLAGASSREPGGLSAGSC